MKKLIEKIQKLLDKAESTNSEAEAQAFFMKAQELMAKNNLEMKDISRKEKKRSIAEADVTSGRKATAKRWLRLASIIGKNFKVEPVVQRGRGVFFIGLETDLIIATKVFKSAEAFMEKRRGQVYRKAQKENIPTKGLREAWEMGFLDGLDENFKRNVEEKALMIVKPQELIEHLEKQNFGTRSVTGKVNNMGAYNEGLQDGRGFNRALN